MTAIAKKPKYPTKQYTGLAKRAFQDTPDEQRKAIVNNALARYEQGELVSKIAQDMGVSDVTLYALLLGVDADAWKDVQTAKALVRLEKANDTIECAPDALSLARAREMLKSAQWELERLLRRLYGNDNQGQQAQVVINISPIREQVIDIAQDQNSVRINSDGTVGAGGEGGGAEMGSHPTGGAEASG